jgi:hypothetical protein
MKRFLSVLLSVLLLASCAQGPRDSGVSAANHASAEPAQVTASAQKTAAPAPSCTPAPAFTAVNARWPENEISTDAILGNYTYYLDTSKILTDGKGTGCMLCRRDNTSGSEEPLNILSYSIAVLGSHLYFLVWSGEGNNFLAQDDAVNALYRLDDGGSRTFICSGWFLSKVSDALYIYDNTLYFTRLNENAIFKADLACEIIERIPIVLPEKSEPQEYCKKYTHGELTTRIGLGNVESGPIFFNYEILNKNNTFYFYGDYTVSTVNHNVVKNNSAYFNNIITAGDWIYYLDLETPIKSDKNDDPLYNDTENPTESDYEDVKLYNIHRMKQDGSGDENLNIICSEFSIAGGWIYYLDKENPIKSDDEEDLVYNIRRVKQDGRGDKKLNITCFEFEIIGKYIYADADLVYGDFAHWTTYRYNMDGTGKKLLKYYDMTRYSENNRLYFTTFDDKIIYVADAACNNVKKIKVKISDDKELKKDIGDNYELGFIDVTGRDGEWICFDYTVTDTGPYTYYIGGYRISLKNGKVEKTNMGEFYNPDTDGE